MYPIKIKDPQLSVQVSDQIINKQAPVYLSDLKSLTMLEFDGCHLDNLDFLKHCKNLEELTFYYNHHLGPFRPLNELPFLPALKSLSLAFTGVTSLRFLINMPNLNYLAIQEQGELDISPLNNLPALQCLTLEGFKIKGADTLNICPSIESLSLLDIRIDEFPFDSFPNVREFSAF